MFSPYRLCSGKKREVKMLLIFCQSEYLVKYRYCKLSLRGRLMVGRANTRIDLKLASRA